MPQMSPINWFLMYLTTLMLFMTFTIKMYFNILNLLTSNNNNWLKINSLLTSGLILLKNWKW